MATTHRTPSGRIINQLSYDGLTLIQHIIPKLDYITEDTPLQVIDSPLRLDRIRSQLYQYFRIHDLLPTFKLKRIREDKLLVCAKLSPATSLQWINLKLKQTIDASPFFPSIEAIDPSESTPILDPFDILND